MQVAYKNVEKPHETYNKESDGYKCCLFLLMRIQQKAEIIS